MYDVDVFDENIATLAGPRDQQPAHPVCPEPSRNSSSIILLPNSASSTNLIKVSVAIFIFVFVP